jgi:hypothetical protein
MDSIRKDEKQMIRSCVSNSCVRKTKVKDLPYQYMIVKDKQRFLNKCV